MDTFEHKRSSSSFCFLAVLMKLFRTSFQSSSELKVNLTGRGLIVLLLSDGVRFPSRLTSTGFIGVFIISSRILDILFSSSILWPLAFGLLALSCSLKTMRFLLLLRILVCSQSLPFVHLFGFGLDLQRSGEQHVWCKSSL